MLLSPTVHHTLQPVKSPDQALAQVKSPSSEAQARRELAWKCAKVALAIIAIGLAVVGCLLVPAAGVIVLGAGAAMTGAATGVAAACMIVSFTILYNLHKLGGKTPRPLEEGQHSPAARGAGPDLADEAPQAQKWVEHVDGVLKALEYLLRLRSPQHEGQNSPSIATPDKWYVQLKSAKKRQNLDAVKELLETAAGKYKTGGVQGSFDDFQYTVSQAQRSVLEAITLRNRAREEFQD